MGSPHLLPHWELAQQLRIEKRNFRKTVKFYQKLFLGGKAKATVASRDAGENTGSGKSALTPRIGREDLQRLVVTGL